MRILVTDGMDKTAMAQLREMGHEVVEQFYEPDQLGKALRDFDVVVVRSKTKVRANHIDEAKGSQLKLIIRGGVGVDNIDVKYAEANGIAVKNTPKASSQSVAELAMGHMFACARYISDAGYTMRNGEWKKKEYGKGIELQGKTLGIVGFGRIGQHLGVMATAWWSSTPPAAPMWTRPLCWLRWSPARSVLPVWMCTPTSPPPTRRCTAIPWCPARRISALRRSRPRSASALRSWTSSRPCKYVRAPISGVLAA